MGKADIIINYIKENTENSTMKYGEKLPTEMEFAQKFSVSRNSVRKALKYLEEEHYIISRQGSGSYISYKKEENYIIIAINEEKILDISGYAERKIITHLKEIIAEKGYIPFVHLTNQFIKPTKPVPLDKKNIKGYISLMNNYRFSPDIYYENIPIVNSLTHFEEDYPGVILDYKTYLIEIERIIEENNIKNPIIFNFDEGEKLSENTIALYYLINKYLESKWHVKKVFASADMADAVRVFRETMKEEKPDCLIFYDDIILKGASKVFADYKIMEDIKIITLSNEDVIFPKEFSVARITYDLYDIAQKTVSLLTDMIERKPITKYIYSVRPKVLSNF